MAKNVASKGLRSRQTINVDFYKVSKKAGGPAAFRKALQELIARKGANRRIMVRGERIDVHNIEQKGAMVEGEFGRLRTHDVPAIATKDCSTKDIALQQDEGITERTAFLFDGTSGILALHVKREALSASKIADLCDEIAKNKDEYFELEIQLNPDASGKFKRMTRFREFTVTYSSSAKGSIQHPDKTTAQFLQGLSETDGARMTVTVSAGSKRDSKLSFSNVKNLLTKAESARNEGVEKLTVSGRGAADELLAVNLIKDRMRSSKRIEVVGQSASYEQRRSAVRECFNEQRVNF